MRVQEVENELALAFTRLEDLILEKARVSDGLKLEPISPFKFYVCWDCLAAKPTAKWVGDIKENEVRLCELDPDHVKHGTPGAAWHKYVATILNYMLDRGTRADGASRRLSERRQKSLFCEKEG